MDSATPVFSSAVSYVFMTWGGDDDGMYEALHHTSWKKSGADNSKESSDMIVFAG